MRDFDIYINEGLVALEFISFQDNIVLRSNLIIVFNTYLNNIYIMKFQHTIIP